ncbi:peptide/nickel transport system ATP-binding protein [Streptoalloteichus tenebrarius]|uniref:Peptide/nickel transport system ATP-binding protein n=1 Tax=Streptoalloteichus tenebrarius (strain ATCC 17920 / DSM 40477 / JCM 4838 / CBS 697.72 / NBRC 16177 / NCIMB 11028 / NRRL B-12390 / A12253. 1 / ISP 5477) TaxID=1933 RepID=A0ABT1HW59_STRSD|nr:dipeptide ABC transporter ATP-binding protein [Streptoalloteichus tenebrarius]MCP2259655.1 peptide/nickel transport system ATP-binding protein [Streptoalloteichus tenebrarius]BFF00937.1 ABC transporter ATP-binding protein [Streptoalloteichus tenebrarius]
MTAADTLLDPDGPGTTGPVLEVSDLTVSFPSEAGRVRAVRGLSYHVNAGEVLGVVGESGSGKSVSSMAVMGLLPDTARVSGSIRFRGRELLGLSDVELSRVRGHQVAMVFQDPLSALTPVYTVGEQVAEAVLVHGRGRVSRAEAARRAVELLDLVGIPRAAERARAFPHEFSGGMRQRVVIAMAIANDPDLIIADEPTTALDVTVQAQVLEVLKTAQEVTGAAIVLITHDLGVVAGFADRLMVMYAGRAVETGSVDEIYRHPRMPYTLGLLGALPRLDATGRQPLVPIEGQPPSLVDLPPGCPFAPRCPMAAPECTAEEPALVPVPDAEAAAPTPHRAACVRMGEIARVDATPEEVYEVEAEVPEPEIARVPRAERTTVLDVRDLVKHFPLTRGTLFRRRVGTVRAVDGVSFDIREGETLGLVGESGCGKTTTLLEILGLEPPMGGSVTVLGKDVSTLDRKARKAVRADLQVVFQDPMASLDPRMPVGDILAEPLRVHGHDRRSIARRVPELLRLVGLRPEHAERYPAEFSGGQRQRIGIARALALEPRLVVLDEPVSALDVSIQAGVINLLDELRAELGLAYLFVAHDLSVVRHIADRVAVMYLGRIVEIGAVDAVFDTPGHPYTQALLSAIPIPDPERERRRERIILAGDLPSPADPPSGCRFRTRCFLHAGLSEKDRRRCVEVDPVLERHTDATGPVDHEVACHFTTVRRVV